MRCAGCGREDGSLFLIEHLPKGKRIRCPECVDLDELPTVRQKYLVFMQRVRQTREEAVRRLERVRKQRTKA